MTVHLQLGENNKILTENEAKIQSMPCKIHADEEIKLKIYFDSIIETKEDGNLQGSFRGRILDGCKVNLPGGYIGLVLDERVKPNTDKEERRFYATHKFNSITYWNYNKVPSKNDRFMQALEWIEIAEALHSPIMEE